MYPGPTIEANQGDRIIVNVTNRLENATYVPEFLRISPPFDIRDSSIHWHGLVCLTQEVSISSQITHYHPFIKIVPEPNQLL